MIELPVDYLPVRITSVLALLHIAEEELDAYRIRHGAEPRGGFALLTPSQAMAERDPRVYRGHVTELLERARLGEDTTLGTDAECLIVVFESATAAPLSTLYAGLAEKLFLKIFGELPKGMKRSESPREPWKGAWDEVLNDLRRRLRDPERVIR